jgi:DNA-binding Lrp family transcriptional regulator
MTDAITKAAQDEIIAIIDTMVSDPVWIARIERLIAQTISQKISEQIGAMDQEILALVNKQADENFNKIVDRVGDVVNDPDRLERIDRAVNQSITQRIAAQVSNMDIIDVVKQQVDENYRLAEEQTRQNKPAVEPPVAIRELRVSESAAINNLAVTGSINTDNAAWTDLAKSIGDRTIAEITPQWRDQLSQQVAEYIGTKGIEFENVRLNGAPIFSGKRLNESITESNLHVVGALRGLRVIGAAELNDTLIVATKRVGINTDTPDMALSVWDEEVSVNIGKYKSNQAYIGTARNQGVSIGVNRIPQLEIDTEGVTTIKKLRVGLHTISHHPEVPGWAGHRGDLVFTSQPREDKVFGWICLGSFAWQPLKSA